MFVLLFYVRPCFSFLAYTTKALFPTSNDGHELISLSIRGNNQFTCCACWHFLFLHIPLLLGRKSRKRRQVVTIRVFLEQLLSLSCAQKTPAATFVHLSQILQ